MTTTSMLDEMPEMVHGHAVMHSVHYVAYRFVGDHGVLVRRGNVHLTVDWSVYPIRFLSGNGTNWERIGPADVFSGTREQVLFEFGRLTAQMCEPALEGFKVGQPIPEFDS